MDQVLRTNIKNNQVNDLIDKKLKFNYNYNLANDHIKYPQLIATFEINKGNKACITYAYLLTCLWDSVSYDITIKENI